MERVLQWRMWADEVMQGPPPRHDHWTVLRRDDGWGVLIDGPPQVPARGHEELFHGTTLSQSLTTVTRGFLVGDGGHTGGEHYGVWGMAGGTNARGFALDRAIVNRGWLENGFLNGWCVPVVLKFIFRTADLTSFEEIGMPPSRKKVRRFPRGTRISLRHTYFEIHLCLELYTRYLALPALYPAIQSGQLLICKEMLLDEQPMPATVVHHEPMPATCGRTMGRTEARRAAWTRSHEGRWWCPICEARRYAGLPQLEASSYADVE